MEDGLYSFIIRFALFSNEIFLKNGSIYCSSISYDSKSCTKNPFYIQTPRLKCVQSGGDIISKNESQFIAEINDSDFSMYDFFLQLDDTHINHTIKNSKEWFNKELPRDIIETMYDSCSIPLVDGTQPQIKANIPKIRGNIECTIFDQQKNYMTMDMIPEGAEVILIIHIRGLRFLKQTYYCDYYISQIKVFHEKTNYHILNEYMIDDDNENDLFENEIIDEEIIDEEIIETGFQKKQRKEKLVKEIQEKQGVLETIENEIKKCKVELDEL